MSQPNPRVWAQPWGTRTSRVRKEGPTSKLHLPEHPRRRRRRNSKMSSSEPVSTPPTFEQGPAEPLAPTSLEDRVNRLAELGDEAGPKRSKWIRKHQSDLAKGRGNKRNILRDVVRWERNLATELRQQHLRPYLENLNAAYREGRLPFPVDELTSIAQHTGGEFESAWRQAQGEANPQFSFVSHTADRAVVQIDSYDAARRVPQELKSGQELQSALEHIPESEIRDPEQIPEFRRHQEQMERQAIFARDRGLTTYEWVVTTEKAAVAASEIKATLPESLQRFIQIRWIRL